MKILNLFILLMILSASITQACGCAVPWRLREIPLVSMGENYRKFVLAVLAASVVAVAALWLGFAADYETTRDVYFAFAAAHVLAEFPFLIKML